jgi:phosphate transport system protein
MMTTNDASTPANHDEFRHHFDVLLEEIRQGMVQMGSLVTENVRRAGVAMVENKTEMVDEVRTADIEVNSHYAVLEKKVFETLARQQPVASDLRFLVSATRILYELERSGDLAVNCVNTLARQDGFPDAPKLIGLLDQLFKAAATVFAHGVDAIHDMDPQAGFTLETEDDVVDDLVGLYYNEIGRRSEEIGLENAISMSRVGRFLERIADHAVNIGENVTYIVTASFPGDTHAVLSDEAEEY